jgi:hypothetical protein
MSTAFYPLGMKSYNNHLHQGGYKTWKGSGVLSNPVGVSSTHIRPLTNNDSGNVFPTGFGLPRPIKHFRKGRVIPVHYENQNQNNPDQNNEISLINYNLNRAVKSSKGSSLSGGAGGQGLLNQMMDNPGGYIIKQNTLNETNNVLQLDNNCSTCEGVGIISSYYPNNTYLTDNPEPNTQNQVLCCNAEKKALRRVMPASTVLKKNYYTTHAQYMQNRCQTFEQKSFNFQAPNPISVHTENKYVKPGSPLSLFNTYFANCQPNGEISEATEIALINKMLLIMYNEHILTEDQINDYKALKNYTFEGLFNYLNGLDEPERDNSLNVFYNFISNPYSGVPLTGPSNPIGCKLVVYKPSNPQFAKQGSVSSSTRILKLNVDTIQTNAASLNRNNVNLVNGTNVSPETPFILKNKAPICNNPPIIRYQNKKACYLSPEYNLYRIPTQPVFSSNHFAQSPVNPLM